MLTPVFCEVCGAANDRHARYCFVCHEPMERITRPLQTGMQRNSFQVQRDSPILGTLLKQRYFIAELLGRGGFGTVYKALDSAYYQYVALKQVDMQALTSRQVMEAMECYNREVQLLGKLRHRNLPCLYDYFIEGGCWYIVFSFIEGKTLDDYLLTVKDHQLPFKETLEIGITLCDVLEYLHRQEPPIIFRDIKPGNIMRTPQGHLYLIDFGIARHYRAGQARDTRNLGSPGYAAPEQYGLTQTSARSDIYSLGVTLQTLLTGREPGEAREDGTKRKLVTPGNKLPRRFEKTLARMLEYEPGKRPATTQEVKERLQRMRGGYRGMTEGNIVPYVLGLCLGSLPLLFFQLPSILPEVYTSGLALTFSCLAAIIFLLEFLITLPILFVTGGHRVALGMFIPLLLTILAFVQGWLV